MDTDPPMYNETQDPNRRLRASAPPPEFPTTAENTKGIELGSNNPFRNAAAGLSNERSVTFSKVADETIDQGSKSLVPVAPSADNVRGVQTMSGGNQRNTKVSSHLADKRKIPYCARTGGC
jgi:hypothetical protein